MLFKARLSRVTCNVRLSWRSVQATCHRVTNVSRFLFRDLLLCDILTLWHATLRDSLHRAMSAPGDPHYGQHIAIVDTNNYVSGFRNKKLGLFNFPKTSTLMAIVKCTFENAKPLADCGFHCHWNNRVSRISLNENHIQLLIKPLILILPPRSQCFRQVSSSEFLLRQIKTAMSGMISWVSPELDLCRVLSGSQVTT